MDSLIPWTFKVNGENKGCAGFSTNLMNLIKIECTRCEHHSEVRAQCKHVAPLFAGLYPKTPPPDVWFTTLDGLPICTDRQHIEPHIGPDVGRMPTDTPAAPEVLPEIIQATLVLDTVKNRLFVINPEDVEKYMEKIYIVNPLKNKVLAHLENTIFKI